MSHLQNPGLLPGASSRSLTNKDELARNEINERAFEIIGENLPPMLAALLLNLLIGRAKANENGPAQRLYLAGKLESETPRSSVRLVLVRYHHATSGPKGSLPQAFPLLTSSAAFFKSAAICS
jgi:hypothetical protein